MTKYWPVCLLILFLAGCEGGPTAPDLVGDGSVGDEGSQQIVTTTTNVFVTHGADDHGGKGGDVNSHPVLILPATVTSQVGESVTVDLLANDADDDAVTIGFDPQTAPRDCRIQRTGPKSARLTCLISSSSPFDSPYTVRVTADDNNGGRTTGFFVWVVPAPEVS